MISSSDTIQTLAAMAGDLLDSVTLTHSIAVVDRDLLFTLLEAIGTLEQPDTAALKETS